MILIDPENALC